MPFAPSWATVLSSTPVMQFDAGTVDAGRSPAIWTGMWLAVSPPIFTSAVRIVPQVKPSANWVHSASWLLFDAAAIGRLFRSCGAASLAMRKPNEPVSSWMLSMVWHVFVPGAHTVTVTFGMLTKFAAPGPTVIGTVFDAVGAIG